MQLTEEQFNEIQDLFPKPRGNVRWGHRRVLNGILYILKHGCPWRSLPACYGRWNTVYELCQEFSAISSGSGDPPIWAGLRSARNFRAFHAASCHASDSGSEARTTPIRPYR